MARRRLAWSDVAPALGGGAAERSGDAFRLAIGLVVVADFERFLDRRQRRFGRIHYLLRVVGHVGRRLACYAGLGRPKQAQAAPRARDRSNPPSAYRAPLALMSYCRSPSYRSGGSKETGIGNLFLIIVNGLVTMTAQSEPQSDGPVILLPTMRPVWGRQRAMVGPRPGPDRGEAPSAGVAVAGRHRRIGGFW